MQLILLKYKIALHNLITTRRWKDFVGYGKKWQVIAALHSKMQERDESNQAVTNTKKENIYNNNNRKISIRYW